MSRTNRAERSWVLVAGGFHRQGGMDLCNWALARYLLGRGDTVHLVCHRAEAEFEPNRNLTIHLVPRPARSFLLGSLLLARRGRQVAARIFAGSPGAHVVVNGGNCNWPDINWVHCVHHAWHRGRNVAPAWFKLKQGLCHQLSRRREKSALLRARIIVANSFRTRRDLIEHLGIEGRRIHVVYPSAAPSSCTPIASRRAAGRAWLGKDASKPLVCFVGALGYDANKGFDILFAAWRKLCAQPEWDADLVVAGGGRAVGLWRQKIKAAGLEQRITLLGFTDRIADLLAAADLLVSPVRYESYGLNVHEAICAGVPAMVSESAGVAERYPANLRDLLIANPGDPGGLAEKLLRWRPEVEHWKHQVRDYAYTFRRQTLEHMARDIVELAEWNTLIADRHSAVAQPPRKVSGL